MIVGVDIGATKTRIGIEKNNKIIIKEFLTPRRNLIKFLIENLSKIDFQEVVIGIADIVNIKRGVVIKAPNIKLGDFIYITIGSGIGAEIFVDNKLI